MDQFERNPQDLETGVCGRRAVGARFNPWRKACGFYLPDVIARQRDLTDGQKRLYERAVRWAGRNGTFWYGFETMAQALGKSVRQVKADMAVLEKRGLIGHNRRGRQSNKYFFLWHSIFEGQATALDESDPDVQDPPLEVQDGVDPEVQPTARESSPLESGSLNSAKADEKLIPDDASQVQQSAVSRHVASSREASEDALPGWDAGHRRSEWEPPVGNRGETWTPDELTIVRKKIEAFWQREPEEGFEWSIMLRARGATAVDVCALLDRKHRDRRCQLGGRWAPRNQNWFLTLIENEFSPGHLPEEPALHSVEQRSSPGEIDLGIGAIELPNASRQ